jgi:CRISPR-associated protein Cmr4
MNYRHALLFYQPVTPLHVGCGQDVGVVDLPVIRERTTGYPFIPGSGIRGSVRDLFEAAEPKKPATEEDSTAEEAPSSPQRPEPPRRVDALFGPEASDGDSEPASGCVAVHDAKLLLFPVRSDHGVFVWITCPFALRRFASDVAVFLGIAPAGLDWSPADSPGEEQFLATFAASSLYLEELSFLCAGNAGAADAELAAWETALSGTLGRADLAGRVVLVDDRIFGYFVHHATNVAQHVRLDAAKTVIDGALFSVEAVPPEALFYGFLGETKVRHPDWRRAEKEGIAPALQPLSELKGKVILPAKSEGYLTLGGDEGTGLGVSRLVWAAEGASA